MFKLIEYFNTLGDVEVDISPKDKGYLHNGIYLVLFNKSNKGYIKSTNNLYKSKSSLEYLLKNNKHSNEKLQIEYNLNNDITIYYIQTYELFDAHILKQKILCQFNNTDLLLNNYNRKLLNIPKKVIIDNITYVSIRAASKALNIDRRYIRAVLS